MAAWYALCGCFPRATLVNSSWTRGHIARLWFMGKAPVLVGVLTY